jgi:predicted SAM-dependent methyltransferase
MERGIFMIKLNLGCGRKIIEGYVNVDFPDNAYGTKPDVETDIRKLPFEDNYADEIMAIHVWEHFYLNEVDEIIEEWKRVLKPGGKIILEMPCLDKVSYFIAQGSKDPRLTLWPLYGDPSTHKSEADLHKWCWSIVMLIKFLTQHGFKDVISDEPMFHVKQRDMRIEAVK